MALFMEETFRKGLEPLTWEPVALGPAQTQSEIDFFTCLTHGYTIAPQGQGQEPGVATASGIWEVRGRRVGGGRPHYT